MGHRRAMDYTFDDFLAAVGDNWFDDDALLATMLRRHAAADAAATADLREFGARVAGPLARLDASRRAELAREAQASAAELADAWPARRPAHAHAA
jgi:hypothetical protein